MIFIKKTSKLFAKNDKKNNDSETIEEEVLKDVLAATDNPDEDNAVWEPKTEEEIKQKAAILKIRELLGEDTNVPIKVSDIKRLEAEKLEAEKRDVGIKTAKSEKVIAKDDGDEIWEPKTEEEKLQYASMIKIRELLGQDTNIPIKKSEVKRTEVVKFVPPKPIIDEKVVENTDGVWKPETEEEKRQQAAILKIRELLGEDTAVPIEKQQKVKTKMVNSMGQEEEPVKRDPKVIIRCGEEKEEGEQSSQYLLLKKLLEEDDKKSGVKKMASGEKSENLSQPAAVSSFGIGNAFTVGAIRNAEPISKAPKEDSIERKPVQTPPAQTARTSPGSVSHFSSGAVSAGTKKNEPAKEQAKVHAEEQEYKRPPEARNPNSGFFMFDFKELIK